jgi:hypothetical protein
LDGCISLGVGGLETKRVSLLAFLQFWPFFVVRSSKACVRAFLHEVLLFQMG